MKITRLSPLMTISGQVTTTDLPALVEQGVDILVCNRPDNESIDQPDFSEISSHAEELGIGAMHLPFSAGNPDAEHIQSFIELLNSGKKIHAYCRTGNRSNILWNAAINLCQ